MIKTKKVSIKIPNTIREYNQWTQYTPITKNNKTTKRPFIPPNNAKNGLSFNEVFNTEYYGFLLSKEDPFCIIDIDHNKNRSNLPINFADFIIKNPTYIEISPSNTGLHLVYKLKGDKKDIASAYAGAKDFEGQVSIQNAFMTFTNKPTNKSIDKIATISITELTEFFKIKYKSKIVTFPDKINELKIPISDIANILKYIPLTKTTLVKRVYKQIWKEEYQHYKFWVSVGMALNNYANLTNTNPQCLALFNAWSQLDEESYIDFNDIEQHWNSFNDAPEKITYKTILKLGTLLKFEWPKPILDKKTGFSTGYPDVNEYRNFEYLLKFFNIKLVKDSMSWQLYITGDNELCEKYFKPQGATLNFNKYWGPMSRDYLASRMLIFCQDQKYRKLSLGQANSLTTIWLSEPHIEINMIKFWLETEQHKLPKELKEPKEYNENSNIDYIFDAIKISPEYKSRSAQFKTYLKKFFLGFLKQHYYAGRYDQNSSILLFLGPENSRKTTFFNMLLPPILAKRYIKPIKEHLKTPQSTRSADKLSAKYAILVWDEFDVYYKESGDSTFKAFLTDPEAVYDEKYEKEPVERKKSAIYGGTTNSSSLKLGRDGTRRIWITPIEFIDTDKLQKVNWHYFFNALKTTEYDKQLLEKNLPWCLTEKEIDIAYKINDEHRAKTSIRFALEDVFPVIATFEGMEVFTSIQKDTSGRLFTTKDLRDTIIAIEPSLVKYGVNAFVYEFKDYCGSYTNTKRYSVKCKKPNCLLFNGQVSQGKYKFWVLPKQKKGD